MQYTVTATIQSPNLDDNMPCHVQWYKGTDKADALAALVSAGAQKPDESMPEAVRYKILSVCMDITEEQEPEPAAATWVTFFASADMSGEGATWSVYREEYPSSDHDEPIDGSESRVGTFPNEKAADAEVHRLFIEAHPEKA